MNFDETVRDLMRSNVEGLLCYIGEDHEREGLKETPRRYIKFLEEFIKPPEFKFTTFKNEGNKKDMIIVSEIPFYSLCEHHIVPFFGTAAIGYIPTDKIAGLSKFPRALDMFARKLQNQERITQQVAAYLDTQLQPLGVGVILKARHLCIEMRGVEKPGTITTTSEMRGVFRNDINCRQEFLNLIK